MSASKKQATAGVTNASYCLSTAVSDFVLMCSCVFGEDSLGHFLWLGCVLSFLGVWRMFLENWKNFNKVFLHGYIWFGFCGGAAALGVFRFGKNHPLWWPLQEGKLFYYRSKNFRAFWSHVSFHKNIFLMFTFTY